MINHENYDSDESSVYYKNVIWSLLCQKYLQIIQKPYYNFFFYNNQITSEKIYFASTDLGKKLNFYYWFYYKYLLKRRIKLV